MNDLQVGEKVMFNGEEFEVIRKRIGVDMYKIAKVLRRYPDGSPRVYMQGKDGLYAEQLEVIK